MKALNSPLANNISRYRGIYKCDSQYSITLWLYDCCYQGLETLLQKDASSSISLISEGAECLFVSKKLFLEHANAKVLRVVSDLVSHVIIISHIAAESVRLLHHSANISGSKIWAFLEI